MAAVGFPGGGAGALCGHTGDEGNCKAERKVRLRAVATEAPGVTSRPCPEGLCWAIFLLGPDRASSLALWEHFWLCLPNSESKPTFLGPGVRK